MYGSIYGGNFGLGGGFWPYLSLLLLWNLFWKGLGLWHSATRKQGWWFLVLLVINTMGILELVYLFGVLKLKSGELIPKK